MYDFPPRTPRISKSILFGWCRSYLSQATIFSKIKMCIFRKSVHFPQAIHKKSYKTRFERGKVCNLQNLALSLRQFLKTKGLSILKHGRFRPYYHKEKGRLNICENFRGRCRNDISPLLLGNCIWKRIMTPNTDFSFGIKISSQQKRILPHAHFLLHYFFFHAAVTILHDIYALGCGTANC